MKKVNNYFYVPIAVVILFIFTNLFISLFLVRNRLDTQYFGEKFMEVREPLRFSFTPSHNNFNIVIIPFKNPALVNKSQFRLRIYSNDEVLREIPFSGFNIGDPSDVKYQFEPIINSRGRDLEFEITGESYDYPILVNVDKQGKPSYRAYYRTTNKGEIFNELILSRKLNLLQNIGFFVVWGMILVGILWWSQLDS